MNTALFIARFLLISVFGVAALAKLRDRAAVQQMLRDFGIPGKLVAPLGILLPLVELIVAIALIAPATAWCGGIGALTLLVLFIAAISFHLAHGRAPACRCFGKLASTRTGWPTLVRNSLLLLIAGFIIWQA
ncbi:MAG: MauE/DoxX family redox-associated membrane protein [Caldilineaceae bacterium]